jgi:DivIVA domain-containing protein
VSSCAILRAVTDERLPDSEGKPAERPTRRARKPRLSVDERQRMREGVRDVRFPTAVRGYDRGAVDGYVKQVNNLIAELETSSSPESAVKRALAEVSEETGAILERAHEAADAITARSRAAADDRLQQAQREAEEVRETTQREAQEVRELAQRESRQLRTTAQREAEQVRAEAETRVQKLDRHAEAVWQERRRLIDDLRSVGQQILETADAAAAHFPPVAEAAARRELAPGGDLVSDEELAAVDRPPASPSEEPGPSPGYASHPKPA